MTRPTLLLLCAFAMLYVAACGGGGNAEPTGSNTSTATSRPTPVGPLAPQAPTEFKAASDCITMSYPAGWKIDTSGDLPRTGNNYCPGGQLTVSKVVTCGPDTVNHAGGIFRLSAPTESGQTSIPGQIELFVSAQRCSTLKDHFDEILAGEQGNATDIGEATDATIAGYPARCATMTLPAKPENERANVCAIEVGTAIYHLFEEAVISRSDELKPLLDQALATLRLNPLGSRTPSPAPSS